jgi:opacity protein-like surface antigen
MIDPRSLCLLGLTLIAHACSAQAAADVPPPACRDFLGQWSGTWSQGYYGTQRIDVTQVSDDCVATLAYSPTDTAPTQAHRLPVRDGMIAFGCNVPGGSCQLRVVGGELRFTYTDPSGFVNNGTFRKDR